MLLEHFGIALSNFRTGSASPILTLVQTELWLCEDTPMTHLSGRFEHVEKQFDVVSSTQGNVLKNSGHLWLAYTELQGDFNMLQLISVDSGHFTRPEL